MSDAASSSPLTPGTVADKATALALRLAHAENALLTLTSGQVDAIVTPEGHTYLLRPAQEFLRQSESRLKAILDSAPDVLIVLSRSGQILSQNGAIGRVLGRGLGDLVGSSIFSLVHEEDLTRFYSAFFNVAEGFLENATVQFRHRDRKAWRAIEATVGRLHDGRSVSIVASFRHVTEPRPVFGAPPPEAGAPETLPAKDRFLAMLSHELRTPLMPVLIGVAELQEDERFAAARPVLEIIRRNVELQARLLDELMEFTTVGQHKVRLRVEPIDAHEHIRFVLEICQSELAAARITVLLNFGDEASPALVCADSARLQQVMWNLLKNAIKFSPPGSQISIVATDAPPGHLTIDFIDQGIGIEALLLPLVFDAFQQGSHVQQQVKGGLGLGLFIAKGLAEAQGGTLTVFSEGLGRGSTFRLTLRKAPCDRSLFPAESDPRFSESARQPDTQNRSQTS